MSKEKMAKSQGNILKISEFKKKFNGQVLRLALISSHYSQPLDWNEKLIDNCEKTINKWYNCYTPVKGKILIEDDDLKPLYDDLNTPGYIANLQLGGIGITALARLIVLQGKDSVPEQLIFEAGSILLLSFAALLLKDVKVSLSQNIKK